MKLLLTTAMMALALGQVQPQCLSMRDNLSGPVNTDLSGITDFGVDLYRQLAPSDSLKNFFFSPYSIWTVLTLAYFGAKGQTEAQMQRALRLQGKVETLKKWRALEALIKVRQASTSNYTFSIANRAYIDKTLPILPCISNMFRNEIVKADFTDIPSLASTINDFSSTSTNGTIKEIVNQDDLVDSLMVFVNAAYFKGSWKYQFDGSLTKTDKFFIAPEQHVDVPMMRQTASLEYGEFSDISARVVKLPYAGEAMSMFLMLPMQEGPQAFQNMVRNLNGDQLRTITSSKNLQKQEIDLQLPKFKLEETLSDSMIPALKSMGITDIFDSRKVDLTGLGLISNIVLDKVIHKAFVEVNEEGTEAAAVTAAIFTFYSALKPSPIPRTFHCNRPFIFFIHDEDTRNILFMGSYKNPGA